MTALGYFGSMRILDMNNTPYAKYYHPCRRHLSILRTLYTSWGEIRIDILRLYSSSVSAEYASIVKGEENHWSCTPLQDHVLHG